MESIEVLQTHISVVFLAGPYAYKIKKPADLGFLDFRTPQAVIRRRNAPQSSPGPIGLPGRSSRHASAGEGTLGDLIGTDMILNEGDNILVAHRRLYDRDDAHTLGGGMLAKAEKRTKILSLSSGTLIVYQLPERVALDALKFVKREWPVVADEREGIHHEPDGVRPRRPGAKSVCTMVG